VWQIGQVRQLAAIKAAFGARVEKIQIVRLVGRACARQYSATPARIRCSCSAGQAAPCKGYATPYSVSTSRARRTWRRHTWRCHTWHRHPTPARHGKGDEPRTAGFDATPCGPDVNGNVINLARHQPADHAPKLAPRVSRACRSRAYEVAGLQGQAVDDAGVNSSWRTHLSRTPTPALPAKQGARHHSAALKRVVGDQQRAVESQ